MAAKDQPRALNELTISLGGPAPHFSDVKFRRQTAHIGLMFLRYLKQDPAYVLDGSPVLYIYFGVPEAQRAMLGPKFYFQEPKGRWSSCCVPKFDLQTFTALEDPAQNEYTTTSLTKLLLGVAKHVGADTKPIRQAAQLIRAGNYTARFPIPGLTCENPAGDRVVRVWSCISRGWIRWQVQVEDPSGTVLRSEWIPDDCSRFPDFAEDKLFPKWDKQRFTLRNAKGQLRYALPLSEPE